MIVVATVVVTLAAALHIAIFFMESVISRTLGMLAP